MELNGTTTATLDRYEGYWGDVAQAAGIDGSSVPDGAARAEPAIRRGRRRRDHPGRAGQPARRDHGLRGAAVAHDLLALDTEPGPFADPGTRAAARAAIDSQVIVDSVRGSRRPRRGPHRPGHPVGRRAARRRRADGRAGERRRGGDRARGVTDRAELPEIAVRLEQQLEAAGFVVTQDVREYVKMKDELLAGGFDSAIMSRNTLLDTGDPLSFESADFTCEGGSTSPASATPGSTRWSARGSSCRSATSDSRRRWTSRRRSCSSVQPSRSPTTASPRARPDLVNIMRDPLERRLITEYTRPAE